MKPDARQIKILQDYLHKTLSYRESYEEVYDHIVSALENQPQDVNFEHAINSIIINDFGGHENLLKVEQGIKAAMITDANKKFMLCLKSMFSFPAVNYLTIVGVLLYIVLSTQKLGPRVLNTVAFIIVFIPPLIALFRHYRMGYLFQDKGKSMRDESFRVLSYRPIWLFSMATVYLPMWNIMKFNIWENDNPVITTLYLMIPIIYNIAIFRLYKSEINLRQAE